MHRGLRKILAFSALLGVSILWDQYPLDARESGDQVLYREIIAAVQVKDWAKVFGSLDRWMSSTAEHYGQQSKETGAAYRYCGEVYAMGGNHEKAVDALQKALAILQINPGPQSQEVGIVLAALAAEKEAEGKRGEAIASLRQALDIFNVNPGPETAITATCLNKLSLLLLYRDALDEAEPLMLKSLRIREKLYGTRREPDLAASLGNLGLLYFRLGSYEEAEESLARSLDILNTLANRNAAYLLGASNVRRTLASVYAAEGKTSESENLLKRALADTSKQFGDGSVEAADAMTGLAAIQINEKRFKEAEDWLTKALQIQQNKLPAGHETILRTQNTLATCFQYEGDYSKAEQILEDVLTQCWTNLGTEHPLTIAVTHNLGMTMATLGDKEHAQQETRSFLNLLGSELEKVLAYFPENRRLGFVQNMGFSPYDLAATLGDGALTAEAVLTFKAAVLESVARDRRRASLATDPDDAKLVGHIDELRRQYLDAQLAGDSNRTKNISSSLEDEEKELSSHLRDDKSYRPLQTVTWKDVASRLPHDAVLLEYVFYNKHLGAAGGWRAWFGVVVLTRDHNPVFKEIGPSDELLEATEACLDLAAEQPDVKGSTSQSAKVENASRDLYDRLVAPVTDLLPRDGARLFICPDGYLSFVSFATLLDHNDNFLGTRFQLSYVDSGRTFLEGVQRQKPSSPSIVLVGAPDFDDPVDRAPQSVASRGAAHDPEPKVESGRGLFSLSGINFLALKGTGKEVDTIQDLFRKQDWQTRLLTGSDATKGNLREAAMGATVIHLATHGVFLPEFAVGSHARISNPMFRSWLALAGANTTLRDWQKGEVPPSEDDGILMASEITGLDLRAAELVVLSACDTAKGEARNGEGILGLRRGVALAGASNLLMTTWEIQDEYTVEFMKRFYTSFLAGMSPAEALHEVQSNELTRLRREQGTSSAVHLAGPFLMINLSNN